MFYHQNYEVLWNRGFLQWFPCSPLSHTFMDYLLFVRPEVNTVSSIWKPFGMKTPCLGSSYFFPQPTSLVHYLLLKSADLHCSCPIQHKELEICGNTNFRTSTFHLRLCEFNMLQYRLDIVKVWNCIALTSLCFECLFGPQLMALFWDVMEIGSQGLAWGSMLLGVCL